MRPILNLLAILLVIPSLCAQQYPEINEQRLQQTLDSLATFGRDNQNRPNRVAFSDGDLQGRAYVISLMEAAGLEVRIDAAANIIGTRAGRNPELKPLALGSHIDMVPLGGNFDGCVGSMGAIEVARTLNERGVLTRHPLEFIIFSNEEGGVMGSRAMAGKLSEDALRVRNSTGYSMAEGIQRLGGDTLALKSAQKPEGSYSGFLELHIEQGAILDRRDLDIGVVTGIVGLNWWDVTFKGMANHAGTTPMNLRKDALLAAAHFIQAVNEEALKMEGSQVATVGRIEAMPGAPNVIPGAVKLSLEIRDLSADVIQSLYGNIQKRAQDIVRDSGVQIDFEALDTTGIPALTDPDIQQTIEEAAQELGLSTLRMPSGAGHDAQDIAIIAPVGMIFVPSRGGISHSPDEYTSPEDFAKGTQVLLNALLDLDSSLE